MARGGQEQKNQLRPAVFSLENPLLPEVRQGLKANPEREEVIKRLFSRNLAEAKDEIIAFRSEDVVTFLDCLLKGSIPVDVASPIVCKIAGWYYLTPIESHPFFDAHPELTGNYPTRGFYQEIYSNTSVYAPDIAFRTAFSRNVTPVLKPNWQAKARRILAETDPWVLDPEFPEALVYEEFTNSLASELRREDAEIRIGQAFQALEGKYQRSYAFLQRFLRLIQQDVDKERVIKFLLKVVQERSGIVVGFNERILEQGRYLTAVTDTEDITHDAPELVIQPKTGFIDLSGEPIIAAIEPLGNYEDRVLTELELI